MLSNINFVQPDVTLRLDLSGVIRHVALSNAISSEGVEGWVGRPWADTVADEANAQVQKMLADARSTGVSSFHQVRQRFPSGLELAVEYATVKLGKEDGLLALGRNLEAVADLRSRLIAAQKSMERDYWKLREVETRYRLLFDASAQPVLLLSSDDTRILEANPAAIRALGVSSDRELLPELLATQRSVFLAMLSRVREQGKAPGILLHLGPDRQPWLVRASLITADPAAVFVLQLSQVHAAAPISDGDKAGKDRDRGKGDGVKLDELLQCLPEGFVVLDAEGRVLRTNRAFLNLIEQRSENAVVGQQLGRWLSRPDADALLGSLQRDRAVREFRAAIRSESGTETSVEISAAANADKNPSCLIVLLRRVQEPEPGANEMDACSDLMQHIELVGQLPLREIVQETVASVERRCIEAALALANGNRTAAAEMLGLSRQSLYAKLSRYATDGEGSTGSQ